MEQLQERREERESNRPGATGAGASAGQQFDVTVSNVNDAPAIEQPIVGQQAAEDQVWRFTVPPATFVDVDAGDRVTLGATLLDGSELPSWLEFDAAEGTFSGTPLNEDVGVLALRLTATDMAGGFPGPLRGGGAGARGPLGGVPFALRGSVPPGPRPRHLGARSRAGARKSPTRAASSVVGDARPPSARRRASPRACAASATEVGASPPVRCWASSRTVGNRKTSDSATGPATPIEGAMSQISR